MFGSGLPTLGCRIFFIATFCHYSTFIRELLAVHSAGVLSFSAPAPLSTVSLEFFVCLFSLLAFYAIDLIALD